MERMAAQEASEAEPQAARGSVLAEGPDAVLGTGGMEPAAAAQHKGQAALVHPD